MLNPQKPDPEQPRVPPKLPKQHNSDWNTVVTDSERNLFFKVKEANTNRSSRYTQQNTKLNQVNANLKAKYKQRQLDAQAAKDIEETKDIRNDSEPDLQIKGLNLEHLAIKRERTGLLVQNESASYYQHLIPNAHFKSIRADEARIYGGRFTQAGNMYYCSSQQSIMLYDTTDPYNFKLISEVPGYQISWTVSDMDVDVNEQFLIYSSIDPFIRLVDLATLKAKQEILNLGRTRNEGYGFQGQRGGGGILSCKFSGDGKEIVGGSKDGEIVCYDLTQNKVSARV